MVHSDRAVMDFLHKQLSSCLNTYFNSANIAMNYTHAAMSESNITAHVNSSFIFFNSAYVLFLLSTDCFLPIFHLGFTKWCRFTSLPHVLLKRNYMSCVLMSLSDIFLQKISASIDHLCQ
jgi:hypothetical protein